MKNTLDVLHVTFDKSPADETVISVAKVVNGKIYVLKMELGEQAELLYQLLTEKTAKVEIKTESKEQDVVSRQEVLKYFEGWKKQIKYYHPYAKNFDIPYEEAIQIIKDVLPVKCVSLEKPNKCEDAISRQMVLDATVNKNSIWNNITNAKGENLEKIILQLPSVDQLNKWIGAEVLDEIRAEIENKYESISDTYHHYETGFTDALEWALSLIDKHIEESEVQE